jgi:hypothetical protein
MATKMRKSMSTNGRATRKKRSPRRPWTRTEHSELKRHSKSKTRVSVISRAMKRTAGALRQQALKLGIGLGHRR